VLSMVVCGIMMLLQDSLARAFGLVGVVAAVRFRNTLKDTKDAVYVFLAIGIGMGCGLRVYHVAAWLSIVLCTVLYFLWRFRVGRAAAGIEIAAGADAPEAEKGKKGKKGKDKHGEHALAQISPVAQGRLQEGMEQRERLRHLANLLADKGKGIKKPNAALLIRATSAAEAEHRLNRFLTHDGRAWHLASASFSEHDGGKLEYLGRVDADVEPAALVESVRETGKPYVRDIEFVYLRKLKKNKSASDASDSRIDNTAGD